MSVKVNPTVVIALARCTPLKPTSLASFLGALLEADTDQLAHMPGTPGTVLAAQFTCYAKQSVELQEALIRETRNSRRLTDLIWQASQPKNQANNEAQPGPNEEVSTCDPNSSAHCKRTAACAAC